MKGVLRTRAILTLFVIALIASTPERSFADSDNVLSFQQRVAYQYAIEQVYWRHRIWPKERPDSKPSLDEVMPPARLEKKVGDYLRGSKALEDSVNASGSINAGDVALIKTRIGTGLP